MSTLDKIYDKLMEDTLEAMRNALHRGVELAKDYMQKQWFDKYQEKYYIRTGEMLDSLDIRVKKGRGYSVQGVLYIKDQTHSPSNSTYGLQRTFEEIHEWFATGEAIGVERYGKELDAIKYTQEQLMDIGVALAIIQNTLQRSGFNFN